HASTPPVSTLSLHDALPIYLARIPELAAYSRPERSPASLFHPRRPAGEHAAQLRRGQEVLNEVQIEPVGWKLDDAGIDRVRDAEDRKSTRLNSSHVAISYAV